MKSLAEIEDRLEQLRGRDEGGPVEAAEMLALSEDVLEHWVCAHGEQPTQEQREGFRLLALHRQGCRGQPSFNACRETCRELVYHYNLLTMDPPPEPSGQRYRMMVLIATHLYLFVSGKMQVAGLGDFCCASRPIREAAARVDHS